ncbi:hypothetical protein C8J56DRAFT_887072 [Mycena floridula]|nr:hypothetical protein C8J56DRAFT_887072 [Mycena floridula]
MVHFAYYACAELHGWCCIVNFLSPDHMGYLAPQSNPRDTHFLPNETLDDGTKENQIPKLPISHFPTSTKPKLLKAKDLDAQNRNSAELTAKPKPKANPSAKRKREPDPAPASDIEDDGQRPKHTRRPSDKVIKNKQVAEEKRLEAEEMKRKRETSGSQSGRKHGQKRNSCIIVLLRCKPGSSVTFKFVDCDRRHHL